MQLPRYPKKQTRRNAALLPQEVTYLQKYCQQFMIVIQTFYLKKPNEFSAATTECVPLFENQLGAYQACDNLANLWGISSSPDSPDSESTLASFPQTPAIDPSPTVTPVPSPSLC